MTNPTLKSQRIPVKKITVPTDRMRKLRPEVVDALAESILHQGLLQPVLVRPRKGGISFLLVAGWHRLEAVSKLGKDTIDCRVLSGADTDQVKIDEIDENLIRADLSPAERSMHLKARKEIYEKLHPETKSTKAGGPGRAKTTRSQNEDDIPAERFTKDAAKKTRKSESQIQREIARATAVEGLPDVVGTSLDKPEELEALSKLPVAEQLKLIARAKDGEKVTSKTAAKKLRRDQRQRDLAAKIKALRM